MRFMYNNRFIITKNLVKQRFILETIVSSITKCKTTKNINQREREEFKISQKKEYMNDNQLKSNENYNKKTVNKSTE